MAKTIKSNEKRFTKARVQEITGLIPRQIQYYTEEGIVEALPKGKTGSGYRREYDYKTLVKFSLIKKLQNLGLSLEEIKLIFGALDNNDINELWDHDKITTNIKMRMIICGAKTDNLIIDFVYSINMRNFNLLTYKSDLIIVNLKDVFIPLKENVRTSTVYLPKKSK